MVIKLAKITLVYVEDDEEGFKNPQTVTITRGGIEDLQDVCIFLAEAIRASGYTFVEDIIITSKHGNEVRSYW